MSAVLSRAEGSFRIVQVAGHFDARVGRKPPGLAVEAVVNRGGKDDQKAPRSSAERRALGSLKGLELHKSS